VAHEDEIDFIPLAEVVSIDEMYATEDVEGHGSFSRGFNHRILKQGTNLSRERLGNSKKFRGTDSDSEYENDTSRIFVNAFQIATMPDGYNSGRSYYLQADSSQLKQKIITLLQQLAKSARKRADETTWFRKIQMRVRTVYLHWIFQSAAAFLIVAVRFVPKALIDAFLPVCIMNPFAMCQNACGLLSKSLSFFCSASYAPIVIARRM
jgi:hypothetical protein